jgi:SAM-dependent methyltransferase
VTPRPARSAEERPIARCDDIHEALHAAICSCIEELQIPDGASLLDVGCWDGRRTWDYAQLAGIPAERISGIEFFEEQAAIARERMRCEVLDIEEAPFPLESASVDLVICNQVLEHCKNIFRPLSEIHRVLRVGGSLLFSVPNLASLHNRLMLLAGRQPSSIRVIGPHVRGFTHRAVRELLEMNHLLAVQRVVGVGFYPLPIASANALARRIPGASHTTVVHAIKTPVSAPNWETVMRERSEQTAFFDG